MNLVSSKPYCRQLGILQFCPGSRDHTGILGVMIAAGFALEMAGIDEDRVLSPSSPPLDTFSPPAFGGFKPWTVTYKELGYFFRLSFHQPHTILKEEDASLRIERVERVGKRNEIDTLHLVSSSGSFGLGHGLKSCKRSFLLVLSSSEQDPFGKGLRNAQATSCQPFFSDSF